MAEHGVPEFGVEGGLLTVRMHHGDCVWLIDKMRARIRVNSHSESFSLSLLGETAALARFCFGLAATGEMRNLSSEDVQILLLLHYESHLSFFCDALRLCWGSVRGCGQIDPVWADQVAKDVRSVMES